jgi:hypothetical protein
MYFRKEDQAFVAAFGLLLALSPLMEKLVTPVQGLYNYHSTSHSLMMSRLLLDCQ